MKNSKVLIILLSILPTFCFCQHALVLKWGLESTDYFMEKQVGKNFNSVVRLPSEEGDTMYRFFETNQDYHKEIKKLFERHNDMWDRYLRSIGQESEPDRDDFISFAKEDDLYYIGQTINMAPVLYFDFVGLSKEYVLESIEIETIEYAEYMGGGFFQNEAWYDIELKRKPGIYTKDVNKKLKFVGSGRAILRFWSDNYHKRKGLSPMGCFFINIKFNFMCDGEKVSVQTHPFNIDV